MTEFDIIQHFFATQGLARNDVKLSIGDDTALVQPPTHSHLAITTDTLIENVHFPKDTSEADIRYKSFAVNLGDLASMCASPSWFTLALTLPTPDETWLKQFSSGLFELANQYSIQLIGGDLTRGPLSITVTAIGSVPPHQALKRSGAKP